MERLRDPDCGCPWDIEQDFTSIAPSTIEEAYEVVDAIERNDFDHLREELGDLLFQVVFYAQMAREQGRFNFDDIAQTLTDKLVRRHPHVFPDGTAASRVDPNNRPSEEFVSRQWEAIKKQERSQKGKSGLLSDIPPGLPAMVRAYKIQKRVAEVGFDWADSGEVIEKLDEETAELKQALDRNNRPAIEEEVGDCLFTLVNLCRHLNINADASLRGANRKFSDRFQLMEQIALQRQISLEQLDSHALEELWQEAKLQPNSTP